uniref:NADH dehydrogenase subunit 6 n=1 Tax=Figulus punctatus TaxID=509906 RepID=UPI00286C2768|nr:NADH dehydrogenase subunit 6 [Figulus punctatus]WKD83639.1 NADH dehydrogenase subunit 6 [Figulus punctatus]
MLILLTTSLSLSMIMIFVSHPLSFGMILVIQTIIISLMTGIMYSTWYSYILFIIMIGGMLVLFMYMTNVASNEKFKLSKNISIIVMSWTMLLTITQIMDTMLIYSTSLKPFSKSSLLSLSLSKYLNFPMNSILILIMIYLLLTLIAVIKITNIKHGPLRHTN